MIRRLRRAAIPLACALAAGLTPAAATHAACFDTDADAVESLLLGDAVGKYALPATPGDDLVVFAHGYRNRSDAHVPHLKAAAGRGAVAVAMDYRGIGGAPDNRGWNVTAGAADSIAAAQHFLSSCPSLSTVTIMGVSMGGNASGLAILSGAKRSDGITPLFDWWINTEGVANFIEEYLLARAVANAGDPYVVGAFEDMETETGCPIETCPDEYLERTVVARGGDIKASGLDGVVIVHAAGDGLVPYDQSRQLAAVLLREGVPTDVFTVLRRTGPEPDPDHEQTTILGYAIGHGADPLAGHAWEGSTTHVVMTTALARLWAIVDGTYQPGPYREFVVDENAVVCPSGCP